MDSFIMEVGISLLKNTPELVAWLVGIFLAVLMVRRGGAMAEKLFLAGCSLLFAVKLFNPFITVYMRSWALEQDLSALSVGRAMTLASLPRAIFSLAGFICLVWAFWVRFRVRKQRTV